MQGGKYAVGRVGHDDRMSRTPVRLMNDYGASWPLWRRDGLSDESEWPISTELTKRLKAWAAQFDTHFHYERGWDDPVRCREHLSEGRELHRRLSEELGPSFEVTIDLWETNGC